ncbi:hypothetical protein HK105_208089 [Polyrhizophydium stewartii]|uniref:Ankyrin repeat domain-containing protein n=1 Tax=Polyrhizophydium stewartii TaxID=2732419 RepID=A0ABR4MYX8_9FUNG|nr:hypothetical protein HK105_004184 [Polyrhizophydium stewartii]
MQGTDPGPSNTSNTSSKGTPSHWDRLPRELKDLVLERSSALTRLSTGALPAWQLQRLGTAARVSLWLETLETDWAGDLARLPRVPDSSLVFRHMRSRGMFERVRALGAAGRWVLRRAAVRNGWRDLLGLPDGPAGPAGGGGGGGGGAGGDVAVADADAEELARAAAAEGAVWLLEETLVGRQMLPAGQALVPRLAELAAAGGQLDAVRWLHAASPDQAWTPAAMDLAAAGGHLDVVEYLHEHRTEGCTQYAMDRAAAFGHLPVVRWLHEHRGEGCTKWCVREVAVVGHVEVLQYLHEHYPQHFADLGEHGFDRAWRLPVLRWLHGAGLIRNPQATLDNLVRSSDPRGVQWACATFGLAVTQAQFEDACQLDEREVVRWMLTQPGIRVTDTAARRAVEGRSDGVIRVLIAHDPALLGSITDSIVALCEVDFVAWMHWRYPQGFGQHALEAAVRSDRMAVAQLILDRVKGIEWDFDVARSLAVGEHADGMLGVLDNAASVGAKGDN